MTFEVVIFFRRVLHTDPWLELHLFQHNINGGQLDSIFSCNYSFALKNLGKYKKKFIHTFQKKGMLELCNKLWTLKRTALKQQWKVLHCKEVLRWLKCVCCLPNQFCLKLANHAIIRSNRFNGFWEPHANAIAMVIQKQKSISFISKNFLWKLNAESGFYNRFVLYSFYSIYFWHVVCRSSE